MASHGTTRYTGPETIEVPALLMVVLLVGMAVFLL